ncbi:MAG: hypothetical protein GX235_10730 [Clostridiales bacterium]|nr:hypothetical protein [Clostridiales bacterium]
MKISTRVKDFIHKFLLKCYLFRREGCIFSALFLTFLCSVPSSLHNWNSSWYVMDYSLGFDSRLLIGSLLRLFHPDYLPAEHAYTFVFISILVLLLLLSYVLGFALRKTDNQPAGAGLLLLTSLYLLSPGSPAYLWTGENMGRFDLYLIILTVFAAILYIKIPDSVIRLIAFTVIGLTALCIHQVFMFIFFPLLLAMYADTAWEKGKKSHFVLGGICLFLLCIAFIYLQLFSHLNIDSPENLIALLSSRTDLNINETALRYEYFATIDTAFRELMLNQLSERIRYGIVTVFLLSPLLFIYGYLWHHILRAGRGIRFKYLLILLSQLSFVPAFLLAIDWGRWFGAFITVQALQVVILAARKDAAVLAGLARLSICLRKHPYLFIAAGIWMASLSKFQATLLPDAPVFFGSLYKLYQTIF